MNKEQSVNAGPLAYRRACKEGGVNTGLSHYIFTKERSVEPRKPAVEPQESERRS